MPVTVRWTDSGITASCPCGAWLAHSHAAPGGEPSSDVLLVFLRQHDGHRMLHQVTEVRSC